MILHPQKHWRAMSMPDGWNDDIKKEYDNESGKIGRVASKLSATGYGTRMQAIRRRSIPRRNKIVCAQYRRIWNKIINTFIL